MPARGAGGGRSAASGRAGCDRHRAAEVRTRHRADALVRTAPPVRGRPGHRPAQAGRRGRIPAAVRLIRMDRSGTAAGRMKVFPPSAERVNRLAPSHRSGGRRTVACGSARSARNTRPPGAAAGTRHAPGCSCPSGSDRARPPVRGRPPVRARPQVRGGPGPARRPAVRKPASDSGVSDGSGGPPAPAVRTGLTPRSCACAARPRRSAAVPRRIRAAVRPRRGPAPAGGRARP